MKKLIGKMLLAIILVYSSNSIIAQHNDADSTNYWINIGAGASNVGMLLGSSINFEIGNAINLSIEFNYNQEFVIFGNGERVYDLGVLFGFYNKSESFLSSISAGIAVVEAIKLGKLLPGKPGVWFSSSHEELEYLIIGLPIEGQLFWRPSNSIGLGITGNLNVNSKKSFAGVMLKLQFGSFN